MKSTLLLRPARPALWLLVLLGLVVMLAIVRYAIAQQPWPESDHMLAEFANCSIDGRELTNAATRSNPIELTANRPVLIEGLLEKWDHPFTTTLAASPTLALGPQHSIEFIAVFRQLELFGNPPAARYDGKTYRHAADGGEHLEFSHQCSAPAEPGRYRLQLLVLERNPAMLATLPPEAAAKPLGCVAECLVRVQ